MALRQINLVPEDELEKIAQIRHLKFWFKCLVLVVALLGTVQGVQYRRISLLRSQLPLGRGINGINLHQNILPTKGRAQLVLKKGADHKVEEILLRK